MANPEALLSAILANPNDPNTANRANDLLGEMFRGYPTEHIRQLLLDPRETVVSTGIWMTTELGYRCVSLLDEALPLLWSESRQIRFWAVETLLWAPPDRAREIARGVELLSDEESSVRWKATDFVIRASEAQLLSVLQYFEDGGKVTSFSAGVRLLLNEGSNAVEATLDALENTDPLMARFGLISAVRRREANPDLLRMALGHRESEEIRKLAVEWLGKK